MKRRRIEGKNNRSVGRGLTGRRTNVPASKPLEHYSKKVDLREGVKGRPTSRCHRNDWRKTGVSQKDRTNRSDVKPAWRGIFGTV